MAHEEVAEPAEQITYGVQVADGIWQVEQALTPFRRRIDAVRRLDGTLIRLRLATSQNPAPTRIEQIENYLLSPRITARTMQLHPAVAFFAALSGAAISGVLGAFGDAAAVTPVAVAEVLAALVQEMVGEPPPRPEPITLKIAYA